MAGRRASFSRRYRVTIGTTFLVLLATSLGLFAVQVGEHEEAERSHIGDRLKEHVMIIDALVGIIDDRVSDLQREAQSLAELPLPSGPVGRTEPLDGGFTLIEPNPELDQDLSGVIVGIAGPPDLADDQTRAELALTVRLDNALQRTLERLPMASAVHYLSARRFGAIAGDVSGGTAEMVARLYQGPAWRLGQPGENRSRSSFWTPVHPGPDDGAQISAAAPVWAADGFLGIVAITVPLVYFERVNGDLAYPLGEAAVISRGGEVLFRPSATAGEADAGLLARLDAPTLAWLEAQPARHLVERDGRLWYRQELTAAPWTLVYEAGRLDVLTPILADRGLQVALLTVVLLIMLVVAWRLTRKDFIVPAGHLVAHIEATARLEPHRVPRVPPSWRPWFDMVSRIFRENSKLASLRKELAIARQMQLSILPRALPERDDLAIDGRTQPAQEVGGDFYDFFLIDDRRLAVAVADVSGKGVAAGLLAMVARTLLKSEGLAGALPGEVLRRVNVMLARENEQTMFVTAFFGVLDLATGLFTYASAGHNPPYLIDASGRLRHVPAPPGIVLGILEEVRFSEQAIEVAEGEKLFLYTDGFPEAFSASGVEYGLARLEAALGRLAAMPPAAMISHLIADVESFATGAAQADDMTCVVLHRKARAGAAGPRDADGERSESLAAEAAPLP